MKKSLKPPTTTVAEKPVETDGNPFSQLNEQDLKNIITLVTIGTRSLSNEKNLGESANIQLTGVNLINKLNACLSLLKGPAQEVESTVD